MEEQVKIRDESKYGGSGYSVIISGRFEGGNRKTKSDAIELANKWKEKYHEPPIKTKKSPRTRKPVCRTQRRRTSRR